MKGYEAYKETNINWLGDIPFHWKTVPLKYICYMKGRIGWQGLKQEEFTNEGPYLITGMNFKNGKMNWDECYHISDDRYNEAPEIHVREGDVLITKDGTIGKLLYMDYLPGPTSLNSHLLILRSRNDSFFPRFLYYLLQSDAFHRYVDSVKTGTTFYGISQEAMGDFRMLVFDKTEQQAIANFLDRKTELIDRLLTKKQRQIELFQEQYTALINQVVTKGLNPNVATKSSGIDWLGMIPEHWQLVKTKYLFRLVTEQAPDNNDMELLSLYTEIGVRPRKDLEARGNKASTTDGYWIVKEGDIIVNKLLAWMGAVGYSAYDGVTSPAYDILRKIVPLNSKFYHYLLRCGIYLPEFKRRSRGIMEMRLRLYFDELGQIPLVYPPVEEQNQIVEFLDNFVENVTNAVTRITREIELLQEYRTALISAAVTGKIDVRP